MPHPKIKAYSIESVISEKFEAMISLSLLNRRMKDFYDIYNISEKYSFEGSVFQKAVSETFQRRGTNLVKSPQIFSSSFYQDTGKRTQWKAFSNRLPDLNIEFDMVVERIIEFLEPIYLAILREDEFFKKLDPSLSKWI